MISSLCLLPVGRQCQYRPSTLAVIHKEFAERVFITGKQTGTKNTWKRYRIRQRVELVKLWVNYLMHISTLIHSLL